MGYLLGHTASALALWLVLYLPGHLLGRWLRHRGLPAGDRTTRAFLGLGAWIAFVFALAALGRLERPVVLAAVAVLAILALLDWRRPAPAAEPAPAAGTLPREPGAYLLAAALALVLAALFVGSLSPEVAWDADAYHLTVPRLYLEHGGFRPVPYNVYSNWPMNVELLFALGMLLGDHVLAGPIHLGLGLLLLPLLLRLARGGGTPRVAAAAAFALFLANPVVLLEASTAHIDLGFAFFLVAGFVFLVEGIDQKHHRRFLLAMAGVASGLLAGTKVSGVAGLAVLLGLLALEMRRRRETLRETLRAGAWLVLPCLLLGLPWLVKSYVYTGNPVYPFFHQQLGGGEWSPELGRELHAWQSSIGRGRSARDYLLLPLRVILEGGPFYDRFNGKLSPAWIVLLPVALLLGRGDPLVRRSLLVSGLYFVFWSATSQQMRFLVPILPLVATAAAASLFRGADAVAPARARKALLTLATVMVAALLVDAGASKAAEAARILPGMLGDARRVGERALPPVFAYIRDATPKEARILFLNTNRGFFCPREYIADSFFEASQVRRMLAGPRDVDEMAAHLAARGITHVLVHRDNWGIAYPGPFLDLLRDPRRARLVYRKPDDPHALYALDLGRQ